jgi:hypothetical protein
LLENVDAFEKSASAVEQGGAWRFNVEKKKPFYFFAEPLVGVFSLQNRLCRVRCKK